jgi:transposase
MDLVVILYTEDDLSLREMARVVGVSHQTIANWLKEYRERPHKHAKAAKWRRVTTRF